MDDAKAPTKVAWKVKEWAEQVSLSVSYTHKMIAEEKIRSVRVGHTRLITTPPQEFIDRLGE
jgi:excisionase family DNA binding protein